MYQIKNELNMRSFTTNMQKRINFLGICGREGAGKNTIANILQFNSHLPNPEPIWELREIDNPLCYMAHVLFGFPLNNDNLKMTDPIWGKTQDEAYALLSDLIVKQVDKDWFTKHPTGFTYCVPFPIEQESSDWVEFSMADPLKKVCSLIFDIPYDILIASTPENRKLREEMYSPQLSVCGSITGRYCLEYFGTDVMRNNFDNDIWIKILKRESAKSIEQGKRVVIPDIRFPNEGQLIEDLDGTLLTIYRKPEDLILTEDDKKTHPAKWRFLTFYKKMKNPISIHNNGTIDDLKVTVNLLA